MYRKIILSLFTFIFILSVLLIKKNINYKSQQNKLFFTIYRNFLKQDTIDQYLDFSKIHKERTSKFGNIIQKDRKIRKDIFFTTEESKILDRIILKKLPELEKKFGIKIKYRENYKLGKYYGDDKGFYSPHTDIQGLSNHRKMSMVICLSDKDDYQGGTFKLVNLNKKFEFDKGDILFFKSNLLHGVEPVTKGIRQVIISFMWDEDGENLRKKKGINLDYNYEFNR